MQRRHNRVSLPGYALTFLVLLGLSAVIYLWLWALDFRGSPAPWHLFLEPGAVNTLAGFGEVSAAVLSVAITVVAIILELAANRYTPRITELFLRDPVNIGVMGSYLALVVLTVWVSMSVYGDHVPHAMVLVLVGAITVGLLTILPYFAYVFDFLTPSRIVEHIRRRTQASIRSVTRSRSLDHARAEVLTGVEQLADVALNSVGKKDKAISQGALTALADIALFHLEHKGQLPDEWFDTAPLVARDQDLVALHPSMVRALGERRTWVEMKVFRQYQSVYGEALNSMRDINHLVAIHTRAVATRAGELGDLQALDLALRFMNTYLRATVNAADVRTAYNLFNEYRALAESLIEQGHEARVAEVAERFKFYGQLGFSKSLPFVLETAAYDLCALLERAHAARIACHDDLLAVFLDVDREPEGSTAQEAALRGVRKAQVKLATYYLVEGEEAYARRIYEDMQLEQAARLRSIRDELRSIVEPEYWEVSDRGINFDFLSPRRREHLDTFFAWFEQLRVS